MCPEDRVSTLPPAGTNALTRDINPFMQKPNMWVFGHASNECIHSVSVLVLVLAYGRPEPRVTVK